MAEIEYQVGEKVQVNGFGYWHPGEVVKVTPKRVQVRYTARTSGVTREKWFSRTPSPNPPHFSDADGGIEVYRDGHWTSGDNEKWYSRR